MIEKIFLRDCEESRFNGEVFWDKGKWCVAVEDTPMINYTVVYNTELSLENKIVTSYGLQGVIELADKEFIPKAYSFVEIFAGEPIPDKEGHLQNKLLAVCNYSVGGWSEWLEVNADVLQGDVRMEFDYEIIRTVVHFMPCDGRQVDVTFAEQEKAIEFAREKYREGNLSCITEERSVNGW